MKKGVLKTKPPSIIHISEGISSRARRFWEHSGMGGTESSSETGRPAVSWSLKVERDVFEAVLRKLWSLGQEHQCHMGTR